jgi:hypothetical protein
MIHALMISAKVSLSQERPGPRIIAHLD